MTYIYKPKLEFVTPGTKLEPTVVCCTHDADGAHCSGLLNSYKSVSHDDGVPIRVYTFQMCGDGTEYYWQWRLNTACYGDGQDFSFLLTKSITQPRCDVFGVYLLDDTPLYSWRWHFWMGGNPLFTDVKAAAMGTSQDYTDYTFDKSAPYYELYEGISGGGDSESFFIKMTGPGLFYPRTPDFPFMETGGVKIGSIGKF